jgi:hypothetical protein
MFTKKTLAASVSAAPALYIEEVMSTFLYTGNGSTQTITNGIDLAGEGGLAWIKSRSAATDNQLFDTERGATEELISNSTAAESADADTLTAFNADGFDLGADSNTNTSAATYCSWTFRKAAKFFDVVTYTGTGSARTIAHNLGSVPGTIIVKRTDSTSDWTVYHRSLGNTNYLILNDTIASEIGATRWNNTSPASSNFSLGTSVSVNASGGTYVAYLFAHDAGGFGDAGDQSVVSCGSFTTDGSYNSSTTLGWEPQWVLVKSSSASGGWFLFDNMRGMPVSGDDSWLRAEFSQAESTSSVACRPNATGFTTFNLSVNTTHIYIAIRRGPMKTPTSGTEVFEPATLTQAYNTTTPAVSSITTDLFITGVKNALHDNWVGDRMRGGPYLVTNNTNAEAGTANDFKFDRQTGVQFGINFMNSNSVFQYFFRRAPGFFDVVAYTGTGSARTVSHNLGVVPELMIVKKRSAADNWVVYAGDATDYLILNTTAATADLDTMWNDTAPTSAVFSLGTNDDVNGNTATFIAYLFATLTGVSKVGSYTGTGTTLSIDCGFTAGARFVLIKRTDSTSGWHVWDTARGIVSGNDPYLLLNSTDAEDTTTNHIAPLNSGFQLTNAAIATNASGGTYIYLAIA